VDCPCPKADAKPVELISGLQSPVLLKTGGRRIDELQTDLDDWINYYSSQRTHQDKMCGGRTPMQTLMDAKEVWDDKVKELS